MQPVTKNLNYELQRLTTEPCKAKYNEIFSLLFFSLILSNLWYALRNKGRIKNLFVHMNAFCK